LQLACCPENYVANDNMLIFLLENGADISIPNDDDGETVVHSMATTRDYVEPGYIYALLCEYLV